jgi:hypothetical protein
VFSPKNGAPRSDPMGLGRLSEVRLAILRRDLENA